MQVLALGMLICLSVLSLGAGASAQDASAGGAIAAPVTGRLVILDEGKSTTSFTSAIVIPVGGGRTTQPYDVEINLPVLGIPLRGEAIVQMEVRATTIMFYTKFEATGQAETLILHGPAGDATVSLKLTQPIGGIGSYDPAEATIELRGMGTTGMFEGVRIAATLTSMFHPTGTVYLGYPSTDGALAAIRRGLAQNAGATDAQRQEWLEKAAQALAGAHPAAFPPETTSTPGKPPAHPVVTETISRSGAQAQVEVTIVVPSGDPHQTVRVIAVQPDGAARTVHQGSHVPGEMITASAGGMAPFVVLVYVADVMVKQITVPAE